ncbi:hypothetical protein BX666DRAFT_1976413 [Dichotomocladium elegans]|nr:hypothetical protein BX666DRAFT_1976413 [Dichotomocladium elegans]
MPKTKIFNSTQSLPAPFIPAKRASITHFLTPDQRIDEPALQEFIHDHIVVHGQPLVIGDFNTLPVWDLKLFAPKTLPKLFKKRGE